MVFISNVIWISSSIDDEEHKKFMRELEIIWHLKIKVFRNVKEDIDYLKIIQFVETKLIVSGESYIEFINHFQNNINDFNVVPKIVIFTKRKEQFINNIMYYENFINNSFYNFGGIKTSFEEIKKFLVNSETQIKTKNVEEENVQMIYFNILIK